MSGKGSLVDKRPNAFGAFGIRADLGASRFGPVYLGRDPSTSARVVIRTFDLPDVWREFAEQTELLDSLRKLCATNLDHPKVGRPLTFGIEGDIPYVVFTYLPGTPMDVVLRQEGARPVEEVLRRTADLAEAIDFAAEAGLSHGMLAPCDVIFDRDATSVTGFGLAHALLRVGIPVEASAPYASPQRVAGAPPSRADDVYSLAAIALELLIGSSADTNHDTSRALREAQGLQERRRVPRPEPHETRLFTTIAGVDAGLLRASFAAAFSDEPGERPPTAAQFVTTFREAFSRRGEEEPSPGAAGAFVSERPEDPPAGPVLHVARAVGPTTIDVPFRQERSANEIREPLPHDPLIREASAHEPSIREATKREPPIREPSMREPLMREPLMRESQKREPQKQKREPQKHESQKHESQKHEPQIRFSRPEPVLADSTLVEVRPLFGASLGDASSSIAPPARGRTLTVVASVLVGLLAGFAGGFVVGQRSAPTQEAGIRDQGSGIKNPETRTEAPADRSETQSAVAPDVRAVAPTPESATSKPGPPTPAPGSRTPDSGSQIASSQALVPAPQAVQPAVQQGRILVRSTPSGAGVTVDGQSRGSTPLALRDLVLGDHTIEVTHPGHDTRQQHVTLTARRPSQSIDFQLRPTAAPGQSSTNGGLPGSLQIASRPSGAQVFVDDNLVGTTPLLVPNVAAGSRRLRLELSGYQSWSTSVQIEPRERFRVAASMEP